MSRPMVVSRFLAQTLAFALAISVVASSCAGLIGSDPEDGSAEPGGETTEPTPSTDGQGSADTRPGDLASTTPEAGERAESQLRCESVSEDPVGAVQNNGLIEASGVVASSQHADVLWSHNDSGKTAGVFAFDLNGVDLGFYELPHTTVDVEDIAIRGTTLYLADIGDNSQTRETITIYVFDEPNPASTGETPLEVSGSRAVVLRYPDGPTDAEAFLVDPVSGEFVILGKNLDDGTAPTTIYTAADPTALDGTDIIELTKRGTLDVAALTQRSGAFSLSGIAFPGAATAIDITEDGSLIALRTYGSVWLFGRQAGATVADALATDPCEGGAEAESQGEAVGFLPEVDDGLVRYVTVSEGRNPAVNLSIIDTGN